MAAGSGAGTPVDRPHPGSDPGRGRRLGIDVGSVRIGVAASDPDGVLATPVETVPRAGSPGRRSGRTSGGSTARGAGGKVAAGADIARIAAIAAEYEAVEIIVGLPRTLRGDSGAAARVAVEFAGKLRDSLPEVPLRLSDARLTT
uniref:RuvX/YqgF family protein n=1 Tax=Nocardia flavorosea TaxID=53429 RepID=UPI002453EDFB